MKKILITMAVTVAVGAYLTALYFAIMDSRKRKRMPRVLMMNKEFRTEEIKKTKRGIEFVEYGTGIAFAADSGQYIIGEPQK